MADSAPHNTPLWAKVTGNLISVLIGIVLALIPIAILIWLIKLIASMLIL